MPPPTDLPTIEEADGTAWTRWTARDPDVEMRVVSPTCRIRWDGDAFGVVLSRMDLVILKRKPRWRPTSAI